jgi:predicted secreted protein
MKNVKMTASVLFMAFFCMVMVSGSFAADNTIMPIQDKQIKVGVDESFVISLESNPSTGYSWMEPQYNHEFLSLTSSQYIPPKIIVCGAPGVQKYTFKALQPGETSIMFQYKRPGDNCIGKLVFYRVEITE